MFNKSERIQFLAKKSVGVFAVTFFSMRATQK